MLSMVNWNSCGISLKLNYFTKRSNASALMSIIGSNLLSYLSIINWSVLNLFNWW